MPAPCEEDSSSPNTLDAKLTMQIESVTFHLRHISPEFGFVASFFATTLSSPGIAPRNQSPGSK